MKPASCIAPPGPVLFAVDRIVPILLQTWSLRDGDLIYTDTPAGVGPLLPGDRVTLQGAGLGRHDWTFV